jgi:hypothetical protein
MHYPLTYYHHLPGSILNKYSLYVQWFLFNMFVNLDVLSLVENLETLIADQKKNDKSRSIFADMSCKYKIK